MGAEPRERCVVGVLEDDLEMRIPAMRRARATLKELELAAWSVKRLPPFGYDWIATAWIRNVAALLGL